MIFAPRTSQKKKSIRGAVYLFSPRKLRQAMDNAIARALKEIVSSIFLTHDK